MRPPSASPRLPAALGQELKEIHLIVRAPVSGGQIWNNVFTQAEQIQLGGDFHEALARLGTIGMWRELHGGSKVQAMIECAHALGALSTQNRQSLLRRIGELGGPVAAVANLNPGSGEDQVPVTDTPKPHWDNTTGQLTWESCVIRTVRLLSRPSNIQLILDAFEAAGWPERIPNPVRWDPLESTCRHASLSIL